MSRKKLGFDIDGVIAEGGYIPPEKRNHRTYIDLKLLEPDIPRYINQLMFTHEVYLISSRNFPDATMYTRYWLENKGVEMDQISGVICDIPPGDKPLLCRLLKIDLHFDDCVLACGYPNAYLVDNPLWKENQERKYLYQPQVVHNWREIMQTIMWGLNKKMIIPEEVAA
jgi:hypothetical protein